METKDVVDNEKKIYNTPELVEHGSLAEMTQGTVTNQVSDVLGSGEAQIIIP